ncbi:hypothetical protein KUV23_04450 [Algoriphagus marincola]|uniref:Uncharacterized protein n=1 Tax=Algoriphagus marincola TaxID=264027 RepID=A0ABS7N4T9_9BACT|nr:hypothetical protein [Algoriphagus marincola]MBY5950210.1 hypothetical protein [Algoriphagus marincola]
MPFYFFLDWIACLHGHKNRKSLIRHQKLGMNSGFSGMERWEEGSLGVGELGRKGVWEMGS